MTYVVCSRRRKLRVRPCVYWSQGEFRRFFIGSEAGDIRARTESVGLEVLSYCFVCWILNSLQEKHNIDSSTASEYSNYSHIYMHIMLLHWHYKRVIFIHDYFWCFILNYVCGNYLIQVRIFRTALPYFFKVHVDFYQVWVSFAQFKSFYNKGLFCVS